MLDCLEGPDRSAELLASRGMGYGQIKGRRHYADEIGGDQGERSREKPLPGLRGQRAEHADVNRRLWVSVHGPSRDVSAWALSLRSDGAHGSVLPERYEGGRVSTVYGDRLAPF